jgi:hypothetical protein
MGWLLGTPFVFHQEAMELQCGDFLVAAVSLRHQVHVVSRQLDFSGDGFGFTRQYELRRNWLQNGRFW